MAHWNLQSCTSVNDQYLIYSYSQILLVPWRSVKFRGDLASSIHFFASSKRDLPSSLRDLRPYWAYLTTFLFHRVLQPNKRNDCNENFCCLLLGVKCSPHMPNLPGSLSWASALFLSPAPYQLEMTNLRWPRIEHLKWCQRNVQRAARKCNGN